MDNTQEQILIGSILGDGSISHYAGYFRYCEEHSFKQKEYLLWKNKFLNYNQNTRIRTIKNNKHKLFSIRKNSKSFKELYHLFYPNGKKVVTQEILDKLTPLGLAVWYMDDGNLNYYCNSVNISTHGFSFEENQLISQWFESNFNIKTKIMKQKSRNRGIKHFNYYIAMYGKNTQIFINIIKYFIIPSMKYKIEADKNKLIMAKEYKKNYLRKYRQTYYPKNRDLLLKKGKI